MCICEIKYVYVHADPPLEKIFGQILVCWHLHSITAMLIPTDTNSVSTQYQSVSTLSWDHHGSNT